MSYLREPSGFPLLFGLSKQRPCGLSMHLYGGQRAAFSGFSERVHRLRALRVSNGVGVDGQEHFGGVPRHGRDRHRVEAQGDHL